MIDAVHRPDIADICKEWIANELRTCGIEAVAVVAGHDVTLDRRPIKDWETYKLLRSGELKNPQPEPQSNLQLLECVWSVSGSCRQAPHLHVELLIGKFHLVSAYVRFGKRNGLTWVPTISTRE